MGLDAALAGCNGSGVESGNALVRSIRCSGELALEEGRGDFASKESNLFASDCRSR